MANLSDSWTIALHGGAGVTPGRDYAEVEAHLGRLVDEGEARLASGESAFNTVEWAVGELEASGLYTAGRGSAPNRAGVVEFDASIICGASGRGGAVAALQDVQSPVAAARAVMERTPHVLLCGEGATAFAREIGLPAIGGDPDYYRLAIGVTAEEMRPAGDGLGHGTVGAAALDRQGRLAAATSTGGVFGKRPGRVGDTPILGAGCWADRHVAASCTGIGEHFILAGGAGDVSARIRYGEAAPPEAMRAMLERVASFGGNGGLILVTADGQAHFDWNSNGLKRAAKGSRIARTLAIL
ncbi:isoaspartyl peptidase/L-asparaginase [Sandaracinobacter sp. RS1-74]|uniref:isoaspartyl peptidase/L-asparaginase family protein n=1 Tax=Sandaracinobacteroides sayramensis TaxID=2913411 RepID=UPI001ED9DA22|nr:isoaspartyl peptidase/L-asparaginase [Sandaracinobacteroides sayramensis]MCG2842119.1 isoaspartyl peptidase/L-asparaginase [Sandaracinobacteroides sayramensis]